MDRKSNETKSLKATLPRKPKFEKREAWSRFPKGYWNYTVPGYAVVARIYPAEMSEHQGEFAFNISVPFPGRELYGYKPTLEEAQREVVALVETNWEITDRVDTEVYNGA